MSKVSVKISKDFEDVITELTLCELEMVKISKFICNTWQGNAGEKLNEKCCKKSSDIKSLVNSIEAIKRDFYNS